MKNSASNSPFDIQVSNPGDIAMLASKFYEDRNRQDGYERENWLCAEYMLAQKRLIERQINSLHRPEILETA